MKIYLSHPIRGPKGFNATHADMQENCDRAILIGDCIRRALPVDLYIPAESEPFVQRAFDRGFITEKQILNIDCLIIDSCDAVIIFTPSDESELHGGCLIEYHHAIDSNKPVIKFTSIADAIGWLAHLIIRG